MDTLLGLKLSTNPPIENKPVSTSPSTTTTALEQYHALVEKFAQQSLALCSQMCCAEVRKDAGNRERQRVEQDSTGKEKDVGLVEWEIEREKRFIAVIEEGIRHSNNRNS